MVKVLERNLSCPNPECTSSRAYEISQRSDGTVFGYCYKCAKYQHNPYQGVEGELDSTDNAQALSSKPIHSNLKDRQIDNTTYTGLLVDSIDEALLHPVRGIPDRCISQAASERYGVRVGVDTRNGVTPIYHLYPQYRKGKLSGFKQRICSDKRFLSIGDCKDLDLFGAHLVPPKGKKLYITEGELDCLALYDALKRYSSLPGWEPPVVSLPSGAGSAVKSITNSLELINGYEEIVLCFDSDSAGDEAAAKVCKLLAGKVSTVTLPEKDPNAMLMKGKGLELKWAVIAHAKKYKPDGIISGEQGWERYKSKKDIPYTPFPQVMALLNELLIGIRDTGHIITITAGTGCGKTKFCGELKYHLARNTPHKIADIALEEDVSETIQAMLSLHLNKRLELPTVSVPENQERAAYEEIYGNDRISNYDYFGGLSDDTLFSELNYLAYTGHKYIFLDHLSIVVSEFAASGGERERIDTIMTKLAKFVKSTGCILFLVVHLKKTDRKNFEEGTVPTLDDLRGSSTIKQLSWIVIALSRNLQHDDPFCRKIVGLYVLKDRFLGNTGQAGYLLFDDSSGRYVQTTLPSNYFPPKNNYRSDYY